MRLFDITSDSVIAEQIPTSLGVSASPQPGAAAQTGTQQAPQLGQQTLQQTDPAVAAQAAKEQQEQKKQIQDQITQTEKQLQDLRKQLAQIS
jgi:hypothetical protein